MTLPSAFCSLGQFDNVYTVKSIKSSLAVSEGTHSVITVTNWNRSTPGYMPLCTLWRGGAEMCSRSLLSNCFKNRATWDVGSCTRDNYDSRYLNNHHCCSSQCRQTTKNCNFNQHHPKRSFEDYVGKFSCVYKKHTLLSLSASRKLYFLYIICFAQNKGS